MLRPAGCRAADTALAGCSTRCMSGKAQYVVLYQLIFNRGSTFAECISEVLCLERNAVTSNVMPVHVACTTPHTAQ
jgi:hypothetical protein